MEGNGCRSVTVKLVGSMISLWNKQRPPYADRDYEMYEQLGIRWLTSSSERSNKRSAKLSSGQDVDESYSPPRISCASNAGLNEEDIKEDNGETTTESYAGINKRTKGTCSSLLTNTRLYHLYLRVLVKNILNFPIACSCTKKHDSIIGILMWQLIAYLKHCTWSAII